MRELGNKIKKDFSVFQNNNLVYLDNGATAQTPDSVVLAMNDFYKNKANIHRGVYKLSDEATIKYENGRKIIAEFLGAGESEVFFTSGTTAGLNILANILTKNLKKGDNVVLTRLEHHANLIPWQQKAKEKGFELRFMELDENFEIDLNSAQKLIDKNTKAVSFAYISNVLGTIAPAKELIGLAKKVGAFSIVDGAQSVAYEKTDVKDLECDFFVFSGHKLYGPTGVGVVYGKKDLLEKLEPIFFGGSMIEKVDYDDATWNESPWKFEAGTPPIAEVIGLAEAVNYLQNSGLEKIFKYERDLREYALSRLREIDGLKIFGSKKKSAPIISFVMDGIHPHDIASILDAKNIAVRTGHHCAMPLMKYLGVAGTVRISFGLYNDKKEIDKLVVALKKVKKIFS